MLEYKLRVFPIDPSLLTYILKVKGREEPNCQLLSEARQCEMELLAWYSTLDKRRTDA